MPTFLEDLHQKLDQFGDEIKVMYTCGRSCIASKEKSSYDDTTYKKQRKRKKCKTKGHQLYSYMMILLFFGTMYWLITQFNIGPLLNSFIIDRDIIRMFIGLLLIGHLKQITKSLVQYIFLPILYPLLPWFECPLLLRFGCFEIPIGSFMSDAIIFFINIMILTILHRQLLRFIPSSSS